MSHPPLESASPRPRHRSPSPLRISRDSPTNSDNRSDDDDDDDGAPTPTRRQSRTRSTDDTSHSSPEGPPASTSPPQQQQKADAAPPPPPFGLSLTLKNTGSVARDHLASERTFLAYVRTSLSFASAGVALVQLFRVSVNASASGQSGDGVAVAPYGRPLGATLIAFGMTVLVMGTLRYFSVQHALPQGLFPAARFSVFLQALSLAVLIGVVFGILVAVH